MLKQVYTAHKTRLRVCDSEIDISGNRIPIVEGELSDVDVVSPNGYRYKRGFWDKVLSQPCVKEMIANRECLGMIEHPEKDEEYMKTPYDKASHVVLSVTVNNGVPYGRFGLLNNPRGNDIKALVDVGVPIGVSTRGLGDILSDSISEYVDDENYGLITWDFTTRPNFPKYMNPVSDSLRESPLYREFVQMRQLVDSNPSDVRYDNDLKKMVKEMREKCDRILNMI